MSTSPIVPCLWMNDQAERAADFYATIFPGGRVTAVSHYPESFDNPGGVPRGSVLTVELEVAGQRFTLLNGGPLLAINPSISFFVHTRSAGETDRVFSALAEGGKALMPLDAYPWSERYGWVQDPFGVSWQVMAGQRPPQAPTIVPCLMFTETQFGRAEEAIRMYAGIFPGGRIDGIERYTAGQGPEGKVVHGRFSLAGQEMVAMDGQGRHDFTFNEALSLQVMCRDQEEVDRYWAALSEGGKQGQCGWLEDRFGLSWQVAPTSMKQWMSSEDLAARERAFQTLLPMGKLDVAALRAAFAGGEVGG